MKNFLLIALAITIAIIVLVTLISYPRLSFDDFERTTALPDIEDITYVEYSFDSNDGYMATIQISIEDYITILEIASQKRSYVYYGKDYVNDGGLSFSLHVYTDTMDTWASFAVLYSTNKEAYYTIRSDLFTEINNILWEYREQAMAEYEANNAD